MTGEQFGEELYRENLYFVYEDKCKELEKEIERLNNIINDLKLCNSDYYNQINNLSSKIFRIKERLDYIETNTETLSNDILDIINDKEISLKHIENHTNTTC